MTRTSGGRIQSVLFLISLVHFTGLVVTVLGHGKYQKQGFKVRKSNEKARKMKNFILDARDWGARAHTCKISAARWSEENAPLGT